MWGAIAGIGLGLLQSYEQSKATLSSIEQQKEAQIGKINADSALYVANSDAISFTRARNRELAGNAITEATRAYAANTRENVVGIKQTASTISAQQEGITAGVSSARQLSSFYNQASKELGRQEQELTSQIISIADNLEELDQQLVAQDQQNFNTLLYNMASGATQVQSGTNTAQSISNIIQGYNIGSSIQSNFSDITATNS